MNSKRELLACVLACVLGGLLLAISDRSFAVDKCSVVENSINWMIAGDLHQ